MDRKMVRKRKRLFKFAVDSFIDLLEQVTKRKINYKCNNSDTACWDNFMNTFSDRIGEDFVRKFLEFGIQSWFNTRTKNDYSRQVRFSWIFGKPAILRWKKFDVATNIYITRMELKKNYDIKIIQKKNEVKEMITSVRKVEEDFKKEFHNTKRGYLWCIANTTLFFHKSANCTTCIFKKECKELLKKEYLKIYNKRGYGDE